MISATRLIYTAILTIGGLIFLSIETSGQSVHLISATAQGWAGGMSWRHGQIYTIHLQIEERKQQLLLDTLWVNGYCISIEKYNPAKFKKGETRNVTIIENLIFDDEDRSSQLRCYDPNKRGVIFSYSINKKRKLMDIGHDIKELDFLAYP